MNNNNDPHPPDLEDDNDDDLQASVEGKHLSQDDNEFAANTVVLVDNVATEPCVPTEQGDSEVGFHGKRKVTTSTNDATAALTTNGSSSSSAAAVKRLCRHPGCTKVVKSQGHCQRHGGKPKRCRVPGCDKQAQGTYDGMCKRHFNAVHFPEYSGALDPLSTSDAANAATMGDGTKSGRGRKRQQFPTQPPVPLGESVYDRILPQSIAYRPGHTVMRVKKGEEKRISRSQDNNLDHGGVEAGVPPLVEVDSVLEVMPLVTFLREGSRTRPPGWHRQDERRVRGYFPVENLAIQLEPWERQLALVEILLLSGGTPCANFRDLAHAWGRERGFHHNLANSVCSRWGEVERKQQSDVGNSFSAEQEASFREKLARAHLAASTKEGDGSCGNKNKSSNVHVDNHSTAALPSQMS